MNTLTRHRIVIAGGGIGGLTTALALAKHNVASCVFERRPCFEGEGAGIQIGPNGMRVLQNLGVSERLKPRAGVPKAIEVRNAKTGTLITALPLGSWIKERHGAPYWVAHRSDLHASLAECVQAEPLIECVFGKPVTGAKSTKQGIAIDVNGSEPQLGDAFIAADGIWSSTRNYVFTNPQYHVTPYAIGKSAARTVIKAADLPPSISRHNVSIWLSPGAHVVHYPVRAGSEVAMIVVLDDANPQQDWDNNVDVAWITDGTQSFADDLRALISAAQHWRKWSLYSFDYATRWVSGRMALLGDAAHPVLPFLAQGAVLAIEDAETLATCIAKDFPDNIEQALHTYEVIRRPRAYAVQRASRHNGEIYHLSGVLAKARDATLRALPPKQLMKQYDWLYRWQVP